MDIDRYYYFVAYRYLASETGVVKGKDGKRKPGPFTPPSTFLGPQFGDRKPSVVDGNGNLSMVFTSPITKYEQIKDAEETICAQQPDKFLAVTILFYQFLYEEHDEGNHESGPEQEEERFPRPSRQAGTEGRVGGRYGKGSAGR